MSCSAVEKQAQYIALNQSSLALAITLPNLVPRLSCSLSRGKGAKRESLVSAVCACAKFSQKSEKPRYFGILPCMDYA